MVGVLNACRTSNLSNLTLEDMLQASKEESFPDAMIIDQRKYKTSFVYGRKALVLPIDIFRQLQRYIKHYRPLLVDDERIDGVQVKPVYR